jgi:hypothetical protein
MGPEQKPLSLVTVCNSPSATAKETLRNSRATNHARCGRLGIKPTEVSSTKITAAPIPATPVAAAEVSGIEG